MMKAKLPTWRAFEGPLTEQLLREPGSFGLGQVPALVKPDATTTSVCGYCSTGCALNIHLREGEAVNLTPEAVYPVNIGMACPKGWEALEPLGASDRATTPMYRSSRDAPLKPISWPEAAQIFCDRMRNTLNNHGEESAAFLSTGQICTEEMALLRSFAKFGMGMRHGDGNTRQCMATSVMAYKQSFGFDAPPYTFADFEESNVIVLIGSNLCIAHPIMWQRVLKNKRSPEIIVIDPRTTETAAQATSHLPLRPKSDLTLFYGLAHLIIREGWVDQSYIDSHTSGFEAFAAHVKQFDPKTVATVSGISKEVIYQLAKSIGTKERVSLWWTMGVNQSYEATRTAQAIINLALMTGNIGRPGTGANSITGQCNAMGSRLFSNTTNLLGGHDFANPTHREKVAKTLGIDSARLPNGPSKAYDQIIDGIERGDTRALWMIATNGVHSWGNRERMRRLMAKLDFLVVQDIYVSTDSAQMADLILPAAGWGEKEGTFINSERRVGVTKKVKRAPGEALADFHIFRYLAKTWGCGEWMDRWESPEAVFNILKELSREKPCDITGIGNYREIDDAGGRQWPCGEGEAHLEQSERRLFEDGHFYTKDKRAKFLFDDVQPNPEPTDDSFPFTLMTGRGTSAQWHTQTRTGKSGILRRLYPEDAYIEMHPTDAEATGLKANEQVWIRSRHGQATCRLVVTPTVGQGQLFMPMHYTETNRLTHPTMDPHSRQPSYKACAVRIRKLLGR